MGGLHANRDLVLLLDVARFKYPPHWVSLEALHRAMLVIDPASGRSRGFAAIRRGREAVPAVALREDSGWTEIERFLRDLDGTDVMVLAGCAREGASSPTHLLDLLSRPQDLPASVREQVERVRAQMGALQRGT